MDGPASIHRVGNVRPDVRRPKEHDPKSPAFRLDADREPTEDEPETGRGRHEDEPVGPPEDDEAGGRLDVTA